MVHPTFEDRKEDIYVNGVVGIMLDSNHDRNFITGRRSYRNKSGDIANSGIPGAGYHCHRMDYSQEKKIKERRRLKDRVN